MRQTKWLQETRMTRFEEAWIGWTESRMTQEEAARSLGVCARTFRRWSNRYPDGWLAIRHGLRKLARHDSSGTLLKEDRQAAA